MPTIHMQNTYIPVAVTRSCSCFIILIISSPALSYLDVKATRGEWDNLQSCNRKFHMKKQAGIQPVLLSLCFLFSYR